MQIVQFVLQISLRPLKFSGLGLFYFGYNFVHKVSILNIIYYYILNYNLLNNKLQQLYVISAFSSLSQFSLPLFLCCKWILLSYFE